MKASCGRTTSDVPGAENGGAGMARGPFPPPPPQQRGPEGAAQQPGSRCFTCNEAGHYARDCPKKRRTGGELPGLLRAEERHGHQESTGRAPMPNKLPGIPW